MRPRRSLFLLVALAILLLAACSGTRAGQANRPESGNGGVVVSELARELDLLAEACTGQSQSLRALAEEAMAISGALHKNHGDSYPGEVERQQGLKTLMRQLSILGTRIRSARIELRTLKQKPAPDYKALLREFSAISSDLDILTRDLAVLHSDGESLSQQKRFLATREIYRAALAAYDEQQYETSILQFEDFLKKYPDSDLAANAHYWIGENYYSAEVYPKALREFQYVVANYPRHKKAADAQLKVGLSHFQMQEWQAAREELLRLKTQYPDYPNLELADKYLRRIQP